MEGMSEREYSAHSGLSRGAIQKARKASRLVVYSDGSINAAASDMCRADMTDPDQQRRSTGGDSGFRGPADSSSYLKARTALTVYQAEDKQLGIQKKKVTLVDRARAEALVSRTVRQERGDAPGLWPACIRSLRAAEAVTPQISNLSQQLSVDWHLLRPSINLQGFKPVRDGRYGAQGALDGCAKVGRNRENDAIDRAPGNPYPCVQRPQKDQPGIGCRHAAQASGQPEMVLLFKQMDAYYRPVDRLGLPHINLLREAGTGEAYDVEHSPWWKRPHCSNRRLPAFTGGRCSGLH